MTTLHTRLLTAALAASTALVAAPALAEGTLTVAQRQDPANWDPTDTFLVAWGSVASNIYDGLVRRDENLELQPGLAESWEVSEDGMTIRFNLRQGVSFHNGEPFDAEAVKYTFDRLLGEVGAAGPQQSNYTTVESVEIVDEHTVEFKMAQPDPVILTKLSGYGAMIVPPDYIEEMGQEHFDMNPVGTGPFKFVRYEQGARIELEANPDYFEGAPELDKLVFRFIREDATRLAELQSGGVDIVSDVAFSAVPTIEASDNAEIVAVSGPTIYSLALKTKDAVTEDVRVRRALNMAVDKQALIDAFLAGRGTPIASLQGELSFGHDPELEGYPFDPEQAMALLKEAGVAPGTEMTIDYRAGNSTFNEVAQALTGFFAAVGLNVGLNPIEDGVFLNEIVPQGRTNEMFQFSWGGWTFDFDNTAYLSYHEGEKWNPYGTSEEMNELLDEQRSSPDQALREEILQEVANLAHEEAYHIPLYNEQTVYAVADRVEGFVPAPDKRLRLTEVGVAE
ncbi:ABC transporter substrate-binding protein [Limimaricola pyoseonensis]|uniref:Peptide/nickel transport system substrate-binding protein n=1 Tax=Limimaricola pyoseonensis TaxID=521013 RepID=A0A1G7FPM6_9RHOB|nr:ABC transporter substrate-binding protein [Limimaricola pyoseonensis]SDE77856.1 peptide/nickel transport system substrate-binding protein [Limimaricola pyoseonensis]